MQGRTDFISSEIFDAEDKCFANGSHGLIARGAGKSVSLNQRPIGCKLFRETNRLPLIAQQPLKTRTLLARPERFLAKSDTHFVVYEHQPPIKSAIVKRV